MKGMYIGLREARLVDDRGNVFIAKRTGNNWLFQNKEYANPFTMFKGIERELARA
jgi:hypothetical protein